MENTKKEYYIKALIDVYGNSCTDVELDWVNYYKVDNFINASNINEAIEEFFNNNLCFNINFKYLDYDEENNCFQYYVLCDVDNNEVNEKNIIYKEWLDGRINLYSNNISLYIYEVTPVKSLRK